MRIRAVGRSEPGAAPKHRAPESATYRHAVACTFSDRPAVRGLPSGRATRPRGRNVASAQDGIFDFSARRGLGRQLEDSRRPERANGWRGVLRLPRAAGMAMRTDACCTGTGAGPAPRLSSGESATDDGAVPCTFSISCPSGRDRSREDSAVRTASQPPERERSTAKREKVVSVQRRRDRTSPRRERRIQSATDNESPCNLCLGPFEPATSTLTNDSPPTAHIGTLCAKPQTAPRQPQTLRRLPPYGELRAGRRGGSAAETSNDKGDQP